MLLQECLRSHRSLDQLRGDYGIGPRQSSPAPALADACGDRVANRGYQDIERLAVAPLDADRGWSLDVESLRHMVAQPVCERDLVRTFSASSAGGAAERQTSAGERDRV